MLITVHSTANNSSDKPPSYTADSHYCSHVVYWTKGSTRPTANCLESLLY